jgi:tetratricopeptide (TPR) repeat protein
MIRPTINAQHPPYRRLAVAALFIVSLMSGCATPPGTPTGPSAEEFAKQQRVARAQANLAEGMKKYEAGSNEEALTQFLQALDSGQLTLAEQITARKQLAFIHCLGGRESNCKEEFEKTFALDAKFELSAAESGHPVWSPIYRQARLETELRRSGRALPPPPKAASAGEKIIVEASKIYDDADYNKAIKRFQDALKETLTTTEQVTAHKFMAFSYCLSNRATQCRSEFEAAFKVDANFDLSPAEAGHPAWGPSFRAVKAKRTPTPPKK